MKQVKRFVVLGDAGAGKSAFINAMYNYCYGTRNADEVFASGRQTGVKLAIPCKGWTDLISPDNPSSERDINDQTKSQTTTSNTYSLQINDHLVFELIDTPGFNDTEGVLKDESNLEQIEKALRDVPFLSGIIIIANGAMVRLGTSFQHFVCLLHEIWPKSLVQNVCVVLTNCTELSCNMDSTTLRQLLHVTDKTIFRMQNNLFRWDRKTHSEKTLRHFRQNFEDVIHTINELVGTLGEFSEVSTNDFNTTRIQQSLIDKSIQELIECMISLFSMYQNQVNAKNGILGAKNIMEANKTWEKQYEINGIKWMEVQKEPTSPTKPNNSEVQEETLEGKEKTGGVINAIKSFVKKAVNTTGNSNNKHPNLDIEHKETTQQSSSQTSVSNCTTCSDQCKDQHTKSPNTSNNIDHNTSMMQPSNHISEPEPTFKAKQVKIKVNLPDNVAISHHEDASNQARILSKELKNLEEKQNILRQDLNSLLEQLTTHVQKIYEINEHVDLVQKHQGLLKKFSEQVKMTDNAADMIAYFDKTVNILSKPSATLSSSSSSSSNSQTNNVESMDTDV